MKYELAEQDNVERLTPYVDLVLSVLGHREALVTDQSSVGDFICMYSLQDQQAQQLALLKTLTGREVCLSDLLWQLAQELETRNHKVQWLDANHKDTLYNLETNAMDYHDRGDSQEEEEGWATYEQLRQLYSN